MPDAATCPRPASPDDIEVAVLRGDAARRHRAADGRLVRRRRDLLRPPGRRRAWSARPRSAPLRGDLRQRRDRREPERVRRLHTHACAVHSVLERFSVLTPEGGAVGLGGRDQRLREDGAGLAPGRRTMRARARRASAGERRGAVRPALSGTRTSSSTPAARPLAAGRQRCRRSGRRCSAARFDGAPPRVRRERWHTPDGDFIDVDWLEPRRADAPLLVLFHGLEGSSASHYAAGLRRRARDAAAGASRRRTSAAARASSTSRRAPTTRATTKRSAGCSPLARASHAGPIVAVGVSLGGNALLRWAEEAGDERCATRARGRRGLVAARPAAGGHAIGRGFNRQVYTRHVPALDEAEGARQAGAAPGPVRSRAPASRRATSTTSTMSSPRRCTASATPTTTGRAARRSRICTASASRRWCSTRATIRSCRRAACRAASEVGRCVTLWQPRHGGHVGFPAGACRAM